MSQPLSPSARHSSSIAIRSNGAVAAVPEKQDQHDDDDEEPDHAVAAAAVIAASVPVVAAAPAEQQDENDDQNEKAHRVTLLPTRPHVCKSRTAGSRQSSASTCSPSR